MLVFLLGMKQESDVIFWGHTRSHTSERGKDGNRQVVLWKTILSVIPSGTGDRELRCALLMDFSSPAEKFLLEKFLSIKFVFSLNCACYYNTSKSFVNYYRNMKRECEVFVKMGNFEVRSGGHLRKLRQVLEIRASKDPLYSLVRANHDVFPLRERWFRHAVLFK